MRGGGKKYEVYLHRCRASGKGYVGITCRGVRQRLYSHESEARRGSQKPFARAIRKYGIDAFETTVLARGLSKAEAEDAEVHFIGKLNTFGSGGYNATRGGEGTAGVKLTQRRREQISEHFSKMPRTEQHRRRCSEALKGRFVRPETLEKMSVSRRGVPQSEEHAAKSRAALDRAKAAWTGMKQSGESKRKMRAAKARVIAISWPDGRCTLERTTYRDLAERHNISHSAIAAAVKAGRKIAKECGLQGCFISNFSEPHLLGMNNAFKSRSELSSC